VPDPAAVHDLLPLLADVAESDAGLRPTVEELERAREHAYRSFRLQCLAAAGWALDRLEQVTLGINPSPEFLLTQTGWYQSRFGEIEEINRALFEDSADVLQKWAGQVKRDLSLLRRDLRHRIIQGRSRLGLVRRFATRCVRYERERLQQEVEEGKAESQLTIEFARFLFDHGLNPLINPKIAGLIPDIFLEPHLGKPIYVEAKQYAGGSPKAKLREGFWQVLSTWGDLRNTCAQLDEAFLLVFRRGARKPNKETKRSRLQFEPLFDLPESLTLADGRRIYIVQTDLAPASQRGSREKEPPVPVSEGDLRLWAMEPPPT
jgi:hypothetical protein